MSLGGTKPPQPPSPPALQTGSLAIPQQQFRSLNRVIGNQQNGINDLTFFFPRLAGRAVQEGALIASFAVLKARANIKANRPHHILLDQPTIDRADDGEIPDLNKIYGVVMNVPVYGWIEFGNVDPQNQSGNTYTGIDGITYTFPNIVLPIAIITVTQPTTIIKTRITGRAGSIKQYIGADDKNITINSVINMPNDQAPTEFLQALQQMKDAPVAIPVTNYFLNALNINYIVIEDISTPQTEGGYSNQDITITACSDIPLTTILP